MENIYVPPTTRTIYPPVEHLRTTPDYTQTTDEDRKNFFTNWNQALVDIARKLNYLNS